MTALYRERSQKGNVRRKAGKRQRRQNLGGRPSKEISPERVRNLASLGFDSWLMAHYFGCSQRTIQRRFSAELRAGNTNLRASLRARQLSLALRGHACMLIWLGKRYLGQQNARQHAMNFQAVIVGPRENCKQLSERDFLKAVRRRSAGKS